MIKDEENKDNEGIRRKSEKRHKKEETGKKSGKEDSKIVKKGRTKTLFEEDESGLEQLLEKGGIRRQIKL